MDQDEIRNFIEAALLAAGRPLSVDQLQDLFDVGMAPSKPDIRKAVEMLNEQYADRGIVIADVASGFRVQIKAGMASRLQKLWEERPPRYSRALFETLALIAYRQPITRGEIEEVRGVAVSTNIVRTLMERDWIRVVGHRDVPGRPALFATTKTFLDYFGLKKLEDLPPLADLSDWDSLHLQLNLPEVGEAEDAETAEITDLPVLHPEGSDENHQPGATVTEHDLPDLGIGDDAETGDELIVSEWPDPSSVTDMASLETWDEDTDADADASAGGS